MSKSKKHKNKKIKTDYFSGDYCFAPSQWSFSDNAEPALAPCEEKGTVEQNGASIKEFGIASASGGKHNISCLTIIGQVEGHYILPPDNKTTKYEHIIPALVAVEQDESVDGLLIVINTVGGDVEAGLAIAELVAGMKKPTASIVLGGGHSIGVPLAVCAKRSFIVPSATMTIHPVRMNGPVVGVEQTIFYFQKMQDRIVRFITQNSSIGEKNSASL